MSAIMDVSDQPEGSVSDAGRYALGLTEPGSHVLIREAGRGDLVIGPAGMGKKADLHVAPDAAIHWPAFDPYATPAGSPWPRYIGYHGNDAGFIGWSERRPIEQFSWTPAFGDARRVDAGAARIQTLLLRLEEGGGHLDMTLPPDCALHLFGDLSRLTADGEPPGSLTLAPTLGRRPGMAPYVLPDLGLLRQASSLSLHGGPMGQAISLQGIERFPALTQLMLWGRFADWDALLRLPRLRALEIRFTPDLQGLPPLDSWPLLDRFIAYNVDEAGGKRLKAQMKARGQQRAWTSHASVSQLRKPEWWQSEYGRPFSGWSGRQAKAANAAYDAARDALDDAADIKAAQAAITAFAAHFNQMKGIETSERDDIGEAVWQFSQRDSALRLGVTEEQAQRWFDAVRDY